MRRNTSFLKKNRIVRKLKSRVGETIGETLAAVLVIVLAMTMLAGAIVAAAKVNAKTKVLSDKIAFSVSGTTNEEGTVTMKDENTEVLSDTVTLYQTKNGYYYYEAE